MTPRFIEIAFAKFAAAFLSIVLTKLEIIMGDVISIDAKLDALKALVESVLPKLGDVATAVAAAKAAQAADDAAATSTALDDVAKRVDDIIAEFPPAAPAAPAA